MVCGTNYSGFDLVPAPCKQLFEYGCINTVEYAGQFDVDSGDHCFGTWADISINAVPAFSIFDKVLCPEIDPNPESHDSTSAASIDSASSERNRRRQTAGRAAKRQRGRARRKLHKALKRWESGFEERAAAISSEIKLTVKSTFLHALRKDSADNEVSLPDPFLATTQEIDQYRRDYRKFRMGHHHGAKGEITSQALFKQITY